MKKFLGILLALVGLLLTAVGIAGMVLIGSDNTVDSPATTVTLGDAKAVVSTPGLLAFTDTTMRLRAQSSGGSVFVGQAHPIDANSYLEGMPRYAVTKVDTSGMDGELVKGDTKGVLPDPAKQTFWTAQATGEGTQTLTMELDGKPTQYVVMPVGKAGDLTMTSGVEIRNGFVLSIAALVLGLLGLVGGLLLMRRRKTSKTAGTEVMTSVETEAVAQEPTAPSRTMNRIASLAVVGAVVPTLAGCGVVPTKVDAWKTAELTKPAMANRAEAVAAMKDYDLRNNAAIKLSHTSFDTEGWSTADGGVLLASDIYDTRYDEAENDTKAGTITTSVGPEVYSPEFSTYPMYALVSTKHDGDKDKTTGVLVAMTRKSVTSPWVKVAASRLPLASLPKAGAFGGASTLSASEQKTTLAAMAALQGSLNTGKGPALPKSVADYLASRRAKDTYVASNTVGVTPWVEGAKGQVSPAGSIQAVKTPTGQLALMTYRIVSTRTAKPGTTMSFTDKFHAKAVGQTGGYRVLTVRTAVTLAVAIDAKGVPKVVGHSINSLT